jgi:hypothetical protein
MSVQIQILVATRNNNDDDDKNVKRWCNLFGDDVLNLIFSNFDVKSIFFI